MGWIEKHKGKTLLILNDLCIRIPRSALHTAHEVSLMTRKYKSPEDAFTWLDQALKFEQKKFKSCPVPHDLVPEFVNAGGWGYVVTGYSLLEQAFKILLHVRKNEQGNGHSLQPLFKCLPEMDKELLREFYQDFRCSHPCLGEYPFPDIDKCLANLDGKARKSSIAWRYYLIEEEPTELPLTCIDYMHEIVFGALRIIQVRQIMDDSEHPNEESEYQHKVRQFLYSQRQYEERLDKYNAWIDQRMNVSGWDTLGDRIEVYGVHDQQGRTDYVIFQKIGGKKTPPIPMFGHIPEDNKLPVYNMEKRAKQVLETPR